MNIQKGAMNVLTMDKYNKLDKIILTEEQHSHIMAWGDKHHKEFDSIDFPFTECLIEIPVYVESFRGHTINRSFTSLYYVRVTDQSILFKQYDKADYQEVLSFKLDNAMNDIIDFIDLKTSVSGLDDKQLREQAIHTVLTCFSIFQYINHKPATIIAERASRTVKKRGKHKQGGKTKIIKVNTVKYTFDLTKEDKREYTRKTEAWPVRGHYRHYKNGKKVWIKPTVKGKGETSGNTYKL